MYNLNSNYGRLLADRIAIAKAAGDIFIVGASGIANRQKYEDIFKPDGNGVVKFFATVDQAVGNCSATSNDTIFVLPGHTETVTATSIALDVAGVNVICLGHGSARPTFTYGAAAATITVSADNVSWTGGLFVGNFDNVAAAFTIGAAKNFKLEGASFVDNTNALHFLSIVVTGATNNAADGLTIVGNDWYGLALAPNAFISILGNCNHVLISDNSVNMAATNDVGHFVTLSSKVVLNFRCLRNMLRVTGATNASVGIFLTGSSTACNGIVANNYVDSLDVTGQLLATAGTKLSFFENYYPVAADKNGALLPANA
jgi:hypothetical protein